METTRSFSKKVGVALSSLYDSLLSVRTGANWNRKLLTCSYMHHRDAYAGTTVEQRTTHDTTAIDAFTTFKDGFVGYLMPRDDEWAMLAIHGKGMGGQVFNTAADVDRVDGLNRLLERMTKAVLSEFAKENYYKAVDEAFTDMFMTGNGYMMAVDDWKHENIYYKVFDPQEVVVADDDKQHLEVFVRKFAMDAINVARTWGDAKLEHVRELARLNTDESKNIPMIEAIIPRKYLWDAENSEYFDFGRSEAFVHIIWCGTDEEIVSLSGYDEMPVARASYETCSSATPYARGLAEKGLDEIIKMDNMADLRQEQFQKNVRPAWVLPVSMRNQKFSSHPDKLNYTADMSQRPMPVQDGHSYNEMMNDVTAQENKIKDFFNVNLFKTLMANHDSRKTAYEVSQLKNESMILLAMKIGNLHKDLIEPIFMRTLKIIARNGEIAANGLMDQFSEFVDQLTLELNSVFVKRLAAYLGFESIMAMLSYVTSVAQIAPDALVNVDMDQVIRQGIVATGAPRTMLREMSEVKKIKKQMAQQMAAQQQAELENERAQANLVNSKALSELSGQPLPPPSQGGYQDAVQRQ